MKIRHNFKILEDGMTVKGQILETIFEEGEERGDRTNHYSKDSKFHLCSASYPTLCSDGLYVWGNNVSRDLDILEWAFSTEERAVQFLKYYNEFLPEEEGFEEEKKLNAVYMDCNIINGEFCIVHRQGRKITSLLTFKNKKDFEDFLTDFDILKNNYWRSKSLEK